MHERIRSLLIYAAKCVTGTLMVFILSSLINYTDFGWCLISLILVLSPDGKDTVMLAFTRIKANLIGVGFGFLGLIVSPVTMWTLSMALILTLSVCYFFKLDAGARSALAATIIIMLHEAGRHAWNLALERVVAVVAGCVLALIITYIFHFKSRIKEKATATIRNDEA